MNPFLKIIGLYDQWSVHSSMDKKNFIEELEKRLYKSNFSIFEMADFSIPKKFEFKGYVNKNGFLIRRRKYFFYNNILNPNIKGTLQDEGGELLIKVDLIPVWYSLLSVVSLILFFNIFINFKGNTNTFFTLLLSILIVNHYFTLKRNIQRSKHDFERELNLIFTKKR